MKEESTKSKIYENRICAMVGEELEKHYGGWEWYVECVLETGVVSVRNNTLDGDYGFYIPLSKLLNETNPQLVMLAGGEILERYNQQASIRNQYEINRDFTGSAIGDINATS